MNRDVTVLSLATLDLCLYQSHSLEEPIGLIQEAARVREKPGSVMNVQLQELPAFTGHQPHRTLGGIDIEFANDPWISPPSDSTIAPRRTQAGELLEVL